MYTYRKKIQKSHSATLGVVTTVDTLILTGFGTNKIADVEVKATLFDVANQKSSIVYYRNIQVVDPAALPNAGVLNNSSFSYAEDLVTAAYLVSIIYNQATSTIVVSANNITATTLNTTCIIDYKINFY
jgi:hypothetical protein